MRIARSAPEAQAPRLHWLGREAEDLVVETSPSAVVERWGSGPAAGRVMLGDNLALLAGLPPASARLAYLDPPFFSGQRYEHRTTAGGRRFSVPAFDDVWSGGLPQYLSFLEDRLRLVARALTPDGSLYVHLDARAAHYVKVLVDEIMGRAAFSRQIVWRIGWISGFKCRAKNWVRNHDVILYYARPGASFQKELLPHPEGYERRGGSEGAGRPLDDVWTDLPSIQLMSFSTEKTGWGTQKGERLARRIVLASSEPGDVVLDPFGGSGTTAIVAAAEGRRFVSMDSSELAVHLTRRRLLAGGHAFTVEGAPRTPRGPVIALEEPTSGARRVRLCDVPRVVGPRGADWRDCLDAWWLAAASEPTRPLWYTCRRRARAPVTLPDSSPQLGGDSNGDDLLVTVVDLAGNAHQGVARRRLGGSPPEGPRPAGIRPSSEGFRF